MKEQIISYLEGPRDYSQGVALYEQFGPNRMLKAKFRQLGECEICLLYTSDAADD